MTFRSPSPSIAIIGGGPAGLHAAEIAASSGAEVTLFDAKPSVGRKLLVAGRGGLNLTKAEPLREFVSHYSGPDMPRKVWEKLLAEFDPQHLIAWAASLGVETFVASTGRVYPKELKAAVLLRRWVQRLRQMGVKFKMNHRWVGLSRTADGALEIQFEVNGERQNFESERLILALGGGSWPETGSDGRWAEWVTIPQANGGMGIKVAPFIPANCGWELPWPKEVLGIAEGKPLKNLAVTATNPRGEAPVTVAGELLITRYGLEGGTIYKLGPLLRENPVLSIDFKPSFNIEQLIAKMGKLKGNIYSQARRCWRLCPATMAILESFGPRCSKIPELAKRVKAFPLKLTGPRPLSEAISSAGGICWEELDEDLMLKKWPGVFVAGEMINWEAPTGGYLLQGCFATGSHVAKAALNFHDPVR